MVEKDKQTNKKPPKGYNIIDIKICLKKTN